MKVLTFSSDGSARHNRFRDHDMNIVELDYNKKKLQWNWSIWELRFCTHSHPLYITILFASKNLRQGQRASIRVLLQDVCILEACHMCKMYRLLLVVVVLLTLLPTPRLGLPSLQKYKTYLCCKFYYRRVCFWYQYTESQ